MKIKIGKGSCLKYRGEVIILFHFNDVRPLTGNPALLDWRCNASVSVLWKRKQDLFRFGQLTVLATQGKIPAGTAILAGLGTGDELDRDMRKEACRLAVDAALKLGAREVAIDGTSLFTGEGQIGTEEMKNVVEDIDKQGVLRIALYTGDGVQRASSDRNAEPANGAV